MFEIEGEREGP